MCVVAELGIPVDRFPVLRRQLAPDSKQAHYTAEIPVVGGVRVANSWPDSVACVLEC